MRLNPRIGGPSALSWPAFWVVLLASVLINLPDRFTVWTGETWWRNLLCNVLAVGAMFAVMWALQRLLLRDAATHPHPWRAVGVFAVGAVVRALVLAALLLTLGEGDGRPLFRVVSSLVILVPLLAFMAGLMDLIRTNAARRAELEAEGMQLRAAEQEALARTGELHNGAISRVRGLLLDRLQAMQSGSGGPSGMGDDLRADVEQVIRPLSHRLAMREGLPAPPAPPGTRAQIAWREVWRSATLGRPFRPAPMAWIIAIASVNALATFSGNPLLGLGYAVALWVIVYVIFALLALALPAAMRRVGTGARTAIFMVASIIGPVVTGLALGGLITATGGQFAWRIPIAIMTLGPVFAWILAIDQGYRRQVAATDADLVATNARLQVSAALAGSVLWHDERRLSRALHGPVQAAVTAAAMRLEAGDGQGAERLLEDALSHLDLTQGDQQGVGGALQDIATAWAGLCQVEAEVADDLERDIDSQPALASAFIDICTEACSNAVRHGSAQHVQVRAVREPRAVTLVVADDGVPSTRDATSGLGTAMLDDVTLEWDRRREDGRTVLRATLPL